MKITLMRLLKPTCLVFAFWFLISFYSAIFMQQVVYADHKKQILFISSYSPSFPTFFKQINGIKSALGNLEVELDIEYMDGKRFDTAENYDNFHKSLKYKLSRIDPYDVIIAADDIALQFAMDYQDDLFKGIPIVFLGINNVQKALMANRDPFMTGVVEAVSIQETIALATMLNKHAHEVIAIVDGTETGLSELRAYYASAQYFKHLDFNIIDLSTFTFKEMENKLENINPNAIVLLLSFYRDKTGKTISFSEVVEIVTKHCKLPIYRLYDDGMGEGFLGGKLISHFEQGRLAGEMVVQIFKGTPVKDIPIVTASPNKYTFDYSVLKKFNLDEKLLPKDTILLNKKVSFFQQYKKLVLGVLLVITFLLFTIFLLTVNTIKRKRAENELMQSHEELTSLYEELEASEEELRSQFDQIQENRAKILTSQERYELVFKASNEGLWDVDIAAKDLYISEKWYEQFFDISSNLDALVKNWYQIIHPDDLEMFSSNIRSILRGQIKNYACEYRVMNRHGEYVWIYETGIAVCDGSGKTRRIAGSHSNITERKNHENRIKNLAYSDILTGLPNRTALHMNLSEILGKSLAEGSRGAIMFLDVDNFKFINDTYGHATGDKVLMEIGVRLQSLITENIYMGRFGGDEFIILIHGIESTDVVKSLAESIIHLFETKFTIDTREFYLTTSIGIVLYPDNGDILDDLLKNADSAMYKAKDLGKNQYQFFQKAMNDEVYDKMLIQNNIRNALENNEFSLYYQPQIDTETKQIIGYEALIRWISPKYGFIPPDSFIKIAEKMGIIVLIGNWVLKTACLFSKVINTNSERKYVISVNVSSVQLIQDNFIETVKGIIEEVGLEPELLGIEITETALMDSFESNAEKIRCLQNMGIHISLDDFGTGYSSLSYLRRLPINKLKIDKSFINGLTADDSIHNLTEDIIMIAHKIGLSVVAEGVETREQSELLNEYDCDILQGYLFSKPLPENDILEFHKNYLQQ